LRLFARPLPSFAELLPFAGLLPLAGLPPFARVAAVRRGR